jgi:hypothetical protein
LEPAQAWQPDCAFKRVELEEVVNKSLSDTKAALEFFSLESGRQVSSRPLLDDARERSLSSSVGSEWFENWPEANDMAASVYRALTAEPSSSREAQADASLQSRSRSCAHAPGVDSRSVVRGVAHWGTGEWKHHAGGSTNQRPNDRVKPPAKPHRQKPTEDKPQKKTSAGGSSAVPSLLCDSLSAAFFGV